MKTAELSHDRLLELLDYDPAMGTFRWRVSRPKCVPGAVAGCVRDDGYLVIRLDGVLYLGHRLAMFYVTGRWPVGVDHRFGGQSAKFSDLREASQANNCRNRGKCYNNTSGFKGVTFFKQTRRWKSQIASDGKHFHLGYFDTAQEAHEAYKAAASRLHGEFANFG